MAALIDEQLAIVPARDGSPRLVPVAILLFVALWMAACAIGNFTPNIDDIEQLVWVRSLEWGYYKHPPLPTWLLWPWVRLLGWSIPAVYMAAAACAIATLAIFWMLLRRCGGANYALIALMGAAGTTYLNWGLSIYNHNSVLQLVATICAACTWWAIGERRMSGWIALGVALGLGALTKYQVAVTVASLLAYFVHQRCWRDAWHRRGLLLAALIGLAIFAPHLDWLRRHDFGPIGYAMHQVMSPGLGPGARLVHALHWSADQLLNRTLPAWLLLAYAAKYGRPAPAPASQGASGAATTHRHAAARSLMLCWGLTPLIFMPLTCLVTGTPLSLHWGAPFLIFFVPAGMALVRSVDWNRIDVRRAGSAFLAIQAVLVFGYLMTSAIGPAALHRGRWRDVDFGAIARSIGEPARRRLGGPIGIVVGPTDVAGAIALNLPEKPLVMVEGRLDRSPWIAAGAVERRGALEVGRTGSLAGSQAIGPALPGWSWRIRMPERGH